MTAGWPESVCRRIEDAGLNASAPREQRWIDGWMVRFAPGKARRARCIQPVAPGRLPIDDRLAACESVYREAGLALHVRISPFAEPAGLDALLMARGFEAIDETLVMALSLDGGAGLGAEAGDDASRFEPAPLDALCRWIGAARMSTPAERDSHRSRLEGSPVPINAFFAFDASGATVACGQYTREAEVAGLYDVLTLPEQRNKGIGGRLCAHLLRQAKGEGARLAYLQVDAANAPALAAYRRLGFSDAYRYFYRVRPG